MSESGAGATDDSATPVAGWQLWIAFLAAPLLWLVHFLAAYGYTEVVCSVGGGGSGARTVLLVATVAFAAAALAAALFARRVWRRATATQPVYDDFLPRVGIVSSVLFFFAIMLEGVPLFLIDLCR